MQNNEKTINQKNGSVDDLCRSGRDPRSLHPAGRDAETVPDTHINPGGESFAHSIAVTDRITGSKSGSKTDSQPEGKPEGEADGE